MRMTIRAFVCLFAVLICSDKVASQEPCFTFNGDSFLVFSPDRFDTRVHYELEFKTNSLNGILMFARGTDDYEALFILGGNLHYLLFNTASSGIERQFGAHHVSEERVDNNSWIKVHVYRSYTGRDSAFRPSYTKTGIEFELNGSLRSYVDNRDRDGINIPPTIYFGGYSQPLSSTVGNFTGQIRGIKETVKGEVFETPSLNYKSLVDLQCIN